MMYEDDLKQAISLIKAGDKQGGGQILRTILKKDRDHERAWLWMTACVETDDDRRYCLEEVLRINPDNPNARKALEKLKPVGETPPEKMETPQAQPVKRSRPAAPAPPPTPAQALTPSPADSTYEGPFDDGPLTPGSASTPSTADDPFLPAPTKKQSANRTLLMILLVVLSIGLVCVICAGGVYWYVSNQINQLVESEGQEYQVEYIVNGNAALIGMTFSTATGETEEWNVKKMPYSKSFTMPGMTPVMLVAENKAGSGNVSCEIKINGKSVSANTSTEPNGQAVCSGMTGFNP